MGVCVFVHGHVSDGVSCTMILRTTLLRSTSSVPCCSWLQAASDELGDTCKMNGQRGRPTRGGQSRVTEAFPATHESSDTGTLPTVFLASHGPGCCFLPAGALALTKRHTTDVHCPWGGLESKSLWCVRGDYPANAWVFVYVFMHMCRMVYLAR